MRRCARWSGRDPRRHLPVYHLCWSCFDLGEQLGLTTIVGIVVVSVGAMLSALPPGVLARIRWVGLR